MITSCQDVEGVIGVVRETIKRGSAIVTKRIKETKNNNKYFSYLKIMY
jgi:hypothetical protein